MAKISVYPSRLEAFGIPLLEAMACGTPVIASDVPAIEEICGGTTEHFHVNNAEGLSQKITGLLKNGDAAKKLVESGLGRYAGFTQDISARKMIEIFKEAHGK